MSNFDKRVDAYVAKSAPFAQPILEHLRQLVHVACPEVKETIKWGFPHFEYNGLLCSMASFKAHCAFSFWKGSMMKDPKKILTTVGKTSMGHFGKITSLKDLPPDKILTSYIHEAVSLNDGSIKLPAPKKSRSLTIIEIPSDLLKELKKKENKSARLTFEALSKSHQREYIEWITEAKLPATRAKRVDQTLAWLHEGKSRNWKYERK